MKLKNAMIKALLVGLVGASSIAYAVTPANTTITNTAQLNYTGLSGPILASVEVTVALTPTAPSLPTPPADQTTAENQSISYVYTMTANSNGSDVYDLSSNLTTDNLSSTSGNAVFTQGVTPITSITLGATAASAVAGSGQAVINVPSDGVADAGVNNLVAGDTVVINGVVYTILAVSDNGVTASITLTSNLTAPVAVGDLIAEQQTFTATIPDVGSLLVSGNPATVTMNVVATSQADNSQTVFDETVTTVVEVTFAKFVRNITNPNGIGGATIVNGDSFYPTAGAVTAESGDVLEYALVVTAPSTALTGVSLTDSIPAFTTYEASSTFLNGNPVADIGPDSPLIGGMQANDTGSPAGTVGAGLSANVTFQVQVD